jgi:Domain of unknown function (DUF4277)
MPPSYRPAIPPKPQAYRTQGFAPRGLGAGMYAALGIPEVSAQATPQNPARRRVTAGPAGKAMGLHGLGGVHPPLDRVPHVFPPKPRVRLRAPGMQARHLNEAPRGRALDTLDACGVTALSSLRAAPAATRLRRPPTVSPLAPTRGPVAGRDTRAQAPDAPGGHSTPGSRREHRPALNPGRGAGGVEHQAGLPLLMQPLRGNSSESTGCGQGVSAPRAQRPPPAPATELGADRALDHAEPRPQVAATGLPWLPRGPAPLREAPAVLAQAPLATRAARSAGYRSAGVAAREGGGAPRWVRSDSDHRQPPAPRTGATQGRQQSEQAGRACQTLGRTAWACAAEAQPARRRLGAGWQTTGLHARTVSSPPPYGQRRRPGPGAPPAQRVAHLTGARAARLTDRRARLDQPRGLIRATHALEEGP